MAHRILFLDIDGVVLPNRAQYLPTQTKPVMMTFDPCAVSLLNQACHRRKFKIVIHSSWLRYWELNKPPGFDTVKDWCIGQGIKRGHFHEDAHCDGNIHWRYDRIDDWLSRHKDVDKYVILDDSKPDEGYPRRSHLILTDEDEGITMDIFKKVLTNPLK